MKAICRGGAELSGAPGLVTWRCRNFLARAVCGMVRPETSRPVPGAVRTGYTQMAESSLYSVRRRYPPGRMGPTFPARAGHCALRSHARAAFNARCGLVKGTRLYA